MHTVEKAAACVVRAGEHGAELLVFRHPLAGIQIPKGSLEPGEDAETAALRELREESGISRARVVRKVGRHEVDVGAGPNEDGATERHVWHTFLIAADDERRNAWSHRASGSEAETGLVFEYLWLPLAEAREQCTSLYHASIDFIIGMFDWSAVPTFGAPDETLPLQVRPSAYGIIRDERGLVLVVRTPKGLHLPGGGADPGEDSPTTVQRETREETGYSVKVGNWRRQAIEHVAVAAEHATFEKRSTFCDGVVIGSHEDPSEAEHFALWLSPAEAGVRLRHESHRWAVAEWACDHT